MGLERAWCHDIVPTGSHGQLSQLCAVPIVTWRLRSSSSQCQLTLELGVTSPNMTYVYQHHWTHPISTLVFPGLNALTRSCTACDSRDCIKQVTSFSRMRSMEHVRPRISNEGTGPKPTTVTKFCFRILSQWFEIPRTRCRPFPTLVLGQHARLDKYEVHPGVVAIKPLEPVGRRLWDLTTTCTTPWPSLEYCS